MYWNLVKVLGIILCIGWLLTLDVLKYTIGKVKSEMGECWLLTLDVLKLVEEKMEGIKTASWLLTLDVLK